MTETYRTGDRVQFTKTKRRGNTTSMRLVDGVIEYVENNVATVRYGKRGRMHCHVSILSRKGEPNAISRTIEAVRAAARGKDRP